MIARRVSKETLRMIGPITKPMNRSIPVHNAPVITCTKLRNQRLGPRIATIIAAKAAADATRYHARSGVAARAGCVVRIVSAKSMVPQAGFQATVAGDSGAAKRRTSWNDDFSLNRFLRTAGLASTQIGAPDIATLGK